MLSHVLQTGAFALAPALASGLPRLSAALGGLQQRRGLLWSVEREKGHVYKDASQIIDDKHINAALETTKSAAKDPVAIKSILEAAKERSFLTNCTPGKSEYVQGLTVEECATLLNIDVKDKDLMDMVYDTAFAIKNRIYGNRIVLFAPLYIANYCVNSCTYCAFRAGNKSLQVQWYSSVEPLRNLHFFCQSKYLESSRAYCSEHTCYCTSAVCLHILLTGCCSCPALAIKPSAVFTVQLSASQL
eukprot:GHUV01052324.1.p1 GENE.GHUV01052324.1~~GHUV01052324.1.p1  ORF type:complete len:245 (-),score=37.04 GHUV01052324.1:31-765(-)